MHTVEKILNNTTPFGKIRASHEGLLHSSTLRRITLTFLSSYRSPYIICQVCGFSSY